MSEDGVTEGVAWQIYFANIAPRRIRPFLPFPVILCIKYDDFHLRHDDMLFASLGGRGRRHTNTGKTLTPFLTGERARRADAGAAAGESNDNKIASGKGSCRK